MPRAIETAEILSPALGGLEVRPECDFCEGHPGEADGLTWAELDERYPVDPGWDGDTTRARLGDVVRDGGAGVRRARVTRRAPSRRDRGGGVPWRGGRALDAPLLRTRPGEGRQPRAWIAPDNSSLTEYRFAKNPSDKSTLPVQLVRYNDHAHLGALERKAHSI